MISSIISASNKLGKTELFTEIWYKEVKVTWQGIDTVEKQQHWARTNAVPWTPHLTRKKPQTYPMNRTST